MSFSVVGPMALQSQRLVGKSDGDKVYFPHRAEGWGRLGLPTGTPRVGILRQVYRLSPNLTRPFPVWQGFPNFLGDVHAPLSGFKKQRVKLGERGKLTPYP